MNRRFRQPAAVAMLAVPALVLAWAAAWSFRGEARRMSERAAAHEAALVGSRVEARLAACVERAKHSAETAVASVAARPSAAALAEMSRREPYVRNAFRWVAGHGVVFPDDRGATPADHPSRIASPA